MFNYKVIVLNGDTELINEEIEDKDEREILHSLLFRRELFDGFTSISVLEKVEE